MLANPTIVSKKTTIRRNQSKLKKRRLSNIKYITPYIGYYNGTRGQGFEGAEGQNPQPVTHASCVMIFSGSI